MTFSSAGQGKFKFASAGTLLLSNIVSLYATQDGRWKNWLIVIFMLASIPKSETSASVVYLKEAVLKLKICATMNRMEQQDTEAQIIYKWSSLAYILLLKFFMGKLIECMFFTMIRVNISKHKNHFQCQVYLLLNKITVLWAVGTLYNCISAHCYHNFVMCYQVSRCLPVT